MEGSQPDNTVRMEREWKGKQPSIFYFASLTNEEQERIRRFHTKEKGANQATGLIFKEIEAPAECVWKVIRRFDKPQVYKEFLVGCRMIQGDGGPGSVRHVWLRAELPGKDSIEQLLVLDDENFVLSFRILGGEHRLQNYISVTSVADRILTNGREGSLVIESYVVDVPEGNTENQTNAIVHTLVRTNLICLEKLTRFEQRPVGPYTDARASTSRTTST